MKNSLAGLGDADDDIIDEEDPIPHDLADSDDEDLVNLDNDDDVALGSRRLKVAVFDRPHYIQDIHGCGGCLGKQRPSLTCVSPPPLWKSDPLDHKSMQASATLHKIIQWQKRDKKVALKEKGICLVLGGDGEAQITREEYPSLIHTSFGHITGWWRILEPPLRGTELYMIEMLMATGSRLNTSRVCLHRDEIWAIVSRGQVAGSFLPRLYARTLPMSLSQQRAEEAVNGAAGVKWRSAGDDESGDDEDDGEDGEDEDDS
ncbi:hypothetical protein Tco_0667224 [Tanacetum coccineum]